MFGCRCRPTRGLSFHLAYDRLVFNGLLFIWGTFKKRNYPLISPCCLLWTVDYSSNLLATGSWQLSWQLLGNGPGRPPGRGRPWPLYLCRPPPGWRLGPGSTRVQLRVRAQHPTRYTHCRGAHEVVPGATWAPDSAPPPHSDTMPCACHNPVQGPGAGWQHLRPPSHTPWGWTWPLGSVLRACFYQVAPPIFSVQGPCEGPCNRGLRFGPPDAQTNGSVRCWAHRVGKPPAIPAAALAWAERCKRAISPSVLQCGRNWL
jgi:hypothetical protein